MADPELSPMPAPAPLLPTTTCPVCARCPAKGKEPEVLVDTLPHLKAKASGSLRGTKWCMPSPALAGPQDVDKDVPGASELPEVQIEHPSSRQGSKDILTCSESIAIGGVGFTTCSHLHLLTTLLGLLWALPSVQHC